MKLLHNTLIRSVAIGGLAMMRKGTTCRSSYSTSDASIAHFDSAAIDLAVTVGMRA